MDFADLLFDEMVIVDQPLGRRRDRAALVGSLQQRLVGGEQDGAVLRQARGERGRPDRLGRHLLGGGEAARMVLDALGAEQFFANGFGIVPGRGTAREKVQKSQKSLEFEV